MESFRQTDNAYGNGLREALKKIIEREVRDRYTYSAPDPKDVWITDDITWGEDHSPRSEWYGRFVDVRKQNKNRDVFPMWDISFSNYNGVCVKRPDDVEMSDGDIEELMEMI